ncbi:MAG TPA: protein tyrosine phosphatase family protein [Longimicrobiales bacterium]
MEADGFEVRDILPGLINAACPLPEVVTGGQPTEEHLQALSGLGYRTILDLRAPGEPRPYDEAEAARGIGMEYVNLPVTPETLADETFGRFRELMRDASKRPVLVHCASGNRVAVLLIPYLVLDEGKTVDDAVSIATRVGLRSREMADRALDYVDRHRG